MPERGRVYELGRAGYIADREPITLPPNAWSFLQNIRCEDGSITSFLGHEQLGAITPTPETMESVVTGVQTYVAYAGGTKIYSWRDGTETEIGSGYNGATFGWDSDSGGGVALFTDGVSNPVYWGGSGNVAKLPYDSVDPANICYWDDAEIAFTARIIRYFKYHWFAFDVTDCSGRNCRRFRWSHPADPGTVPITWDFTRADYQAGDGQCAEDQGCIIDAVLLGDTIQVYKSSAIYQITYTGHSGSAQPFFNIRRVTDAWGIYAKGCAVDIGGRHFVVGDKQIYLWDGHSPTPIADERVKLLFFDGVSRNNKDRTFVTFYERLGEVWLCYPSANATTCDTALVYNVKDNTWYQRDLPSVTAAIYVRPDRSSGYTWDSPPTGTTTWDAWPPSGEPTWTTWDALTDDLPDNERLILGGPQNLWEMDRTNQANGANIECIARRTHLEPGDQADWHQVLSVYPRSQGDAFNVRLGYHANINDAVTWTSYQSFDPDTDYKLDFRVNGRLHAIEFQSNADVSWKVDGYEIDIAYSGRR